MFIAQQPRLNNSIPKSLLVQSTHRVLVDLAQLDAVPEQLADVVDLVPNHRGPKTRQ